MASSAARSLRGVIRSPRPSPKNFLTPELNVTPTFISTPKLIRRKSLTLVPPCHEVSVRPRKLFNNFDGDEIEKETSTNVLLNEIFPTEKVSPITESLVPDTGALIVNYDGNTKNLTVLGNGSFGTVILARHKGELVAAKIIDEKGQSTITSELNGVGLKHPNVVEVLDIMINQNKSLGIVIMEACLGESLQNIIRSPCSLEEKQRYLTDTCFGLEYIHSKSILHLDIKPKNILVNRVNKTSKIVDFGSSVTMTDVNLKTYKKIQGTVKYCAPEILKGEKPTFKSDVYSLGITMWHVLYEEIPYNGIENDILVYQVVLNNLRPDSKLIQHEFPQVPEEFIQICKQCWDSNPDYRPQLSDIIKKLQTTNCFQAELL